jgi:peptidoglycan-associated lipoprotein
MRRVVLFVLACALFSTAGCSIFGGGKKSPGDEGAGDGNIPVAAPGSELADVNFAYDSSALDGNASGILRTNGKWLLDNPAVNAVIEGHCDERGTAEYNLALGERRAQSALDFLRSLGVPASRMSTISYGKELPLDPGHNEEAWAKNRRAHFTVKK